ncbi:rab-GTPase-TBC domain protein (macronuclear) [Tetrahymena thermophila SB210]|uniref:Rab-GTPase-TBC domain protein n=1 Tax=Tetrahymena thermophila (strain SB210) TaxID=312017 RepID=Q22H03_TETTS|nr:rab-GTPase-TBC domain protein [Tetrahymena thermophila SB210]EAR84521.1 rab-GTPase-TBC domain protein [Tetrahymena thermophila SB210]|eukprot:XP_001032184.1 rab-GTPase-TBC domain protein [Tetrahymena thermophila SB210]
MFSKKKQHYSSLNADSDVHVKTINCTESSISNYLLTEKSCHQNKQKPQSISSLSKNAPLNQIDQLQTRMKTQPSSSLHFSKNINYTNSYSVMSKIVKQSKVRNSLSSQQNASKLSQRSKDFKPKLSERFQTQAHATNISDDDFEEGQNDSFFCREDDDLHLIPGQTVVNMIPVSPNKKYKINNELEFFPSKKKIIHTSLPHQKISIDGYKNANEQSGQIIGNIQSNVLSDTFLTMNTCRGEESQVFDFKCETVANCEENQQINNQQISRKIINKSLSSVNNQKSQQQQIQQSEYFLNSNQQNLNINQVQAHKDEQQMIHQNQQDMCKNYDKANKVQTQINKNECLSNQNEFQPKQNECLSNQNECLSNQNKCLQNQNELLQNYNKFQFNQNEKAELKLQSEQQMNNQDQYCRPQQKIQNEQLQSILDQQQVYLNLQKITQKEEEQVENHLEQQLYSNSKQVISPRNIYDQTRYFNQQNNISSLNERQHTHLSDKYKEDYLYHSQWGYQSKKLNGVHSTCMTQFSPLKTEAGVHQITEVSQDNRRESSLFRLRYNCNSGLSQNNKDLLNYYDQVLAPQLANSSIRRISTNNYEQSSLSQQNNHNNLSGNNQNYIYKQNLQEQITNVLVQNNSKINCNNLNVINNQNKTISHSNSKEKQSCKNYNQVLSQKQNSNILSHTNSLNSTKSNIYLSNANKNISMHSSRNSTNKNSVYQQENLIIQNKKHQSLSQASNTSYQNGKYSKKNLNQKNQSTKNSIQITSKDQGAGLNVKNSNKVDLIKAQKSISDVKNDYSKQLNNHESFNNYQTHHQTIQQSYQPEQNAFNCLSNQFKHDIDTVLHYNYSFNKTNNTIPKNSKNALYQTTQNEININNDKKYFLSHANDTTAGKDQRLSINLPKQFEKENKQTEILLQKKEDISKLERIPTQQSVPNTISETQTKTINEFQTNTIQFQSNKIQDSKQSLKENQNNIKASQNGFMKDVQSSQTADAQNTNQQQIKNINVAQAIQQSEANNNSKVKENINYMNAIQNGSGQKSLMDTIKTNIINLVVKTFRGGDKRDQCNCDEGLEDYQTCSRAQKWLQWNYPENLDSLKTLYNQIKETRSSVVDPSVLQQIRRDITRTYPHLKFFQPLNDSQSSQGQSLPSKIENNQNKISSGLEQLESILYSFAAYDPQIGYVQGINFIAAHFLYHSEEYIAFWLLVNTFERFELRDIYLPNLPGLKKHSYILEKILEKIDPELYSHLSESGIKPDMYITPWLFSQFGMMIPLKYLDIFYENMIQEGWSFFYKFVISYMIEQKQLILEQDPMGSIEILTQKNNQIANEQYSEEKEWSDLIQDAKKIPINSKDIESMLNTINFQD